jgi:hypothetical protein
MVNRTLRCRRARVAHPALERIHSPLRLGLGEVDPQGLHLGDALEILADERRPRSDR